MPHAIGIRRGLISGANIPPRRAHVRGETRSLATKLANPEAERPDVVTLSPEIDPLKLATLEKMRRRYLRGKRGARPSPLAELVLWGPPRHAAEDAWPRERSQEWGEASLKWVRAHFPDSPVTESALHMDEGSPHVHVCLFPRYTDAAGETAYGWKRAERAATDRLRGDEPLLNAGRQHVRGRERAGDAMTMLLDDYHKSVGARFGLARGERGSGRKHRAITIDEATRRHAEDRSAKLDVREAEIAEADAESKRTDAASKRRKVRLDKEIARFNQHVGEFNANVKARAARFEERENGLKARIAAQVERDKAERERLNERARHIEADERAHGTLVEQRRRVKRRGDVAERKLRIAERTDLANREKIDRISMAMKCLDAGLGSPRIEDAGLWMDRAHLAVHGDERERAAIAALFAKPGAAPAAKRDWGQALRSSSAVRRPGPASAHRPIRRFDEPRAGGFGGSRR